MLPLDEYDELIAEELKREAEAERRRRAQAMRHPDPRDPEWRGSDDPEEPMPKFKAGPLRVGTGFGYSTWVGDKPHIYRRGGKWVCSSFARGLARHMYQDTPVAAYNAWLEYWDDIYRRLNALAPYQPRPR